VRVRLVVKGQSQETICDACFAGRSLQVSKLEHSALQRGVPTQTTAVHYVYTLRVHRSADELQTQHNQGAVPSK